MDWTIMGDQKIISKIDVVGARGTYGGRDYTAWFAPSFPVPFGPYHFGGLPGLILEITSDDGLVTYTFDGYHDRIQDERFTVTPPVDGKYATREEFEKFVIFSLLRAEALSTSTMTVTHGIAHPDYVIIKNRYTTIRDYKRERGY
ncbi:hypothetical protein GGR27_001897 [Lewinella antarctica]|uniref:GLPGLI family protein n=2 Tax=Neolewinella antarctica TaxID=442734 RepID=A0ABX0XBU2_9BACT|nr:hypothetical protein [Neolewinella antarctica]